MRDAGAMAGNVALKVVLGFLDFFVFCFPHYCKQFRKGRVTPAHSLKLHHDREGVAAGT